MWWIRNCPSRFLHSSEDLERRGNLSGEIKYLTSPTKLNKYNMALSGHGKISVGAYYFLSWLANKCIMNLRDLIKTPQPDHASLMLTPFAAKRVTMWRSSLNCIVDDLFISRALNTIYMQMRPRFNRSHHPLRWAWNLHIQLAINISLQMIHTHLRLDVTWLAPHPLPWLLQWKEPWCTQILVQKNQNPLLPFLLAPLS